MQHNLGLFKSGKRNKTFDETMDVSCNDKKCCVRFTSKYPWFDGNRTDYDYELYDKGSIEYDYYKRFLDKNQINSIKYKIKNLFCNDKFCNVLFTVKTSSFNSEIITSVHDCLSYYKGTDDYDNLKKYLDDKSIDSINYE